MPPLLLHHQTFFSFYHILQTAQNKKAPCAAAFQGEKTAFGDEGAIFCDSL